MGLQEELSRSIQTGFIDHLVLSGKEFRPEILTNDYKQGKKVLSTILRELETCEEFWFSVAFVTTGGIATLMNTLLELEKKNIKGRILASQYLNFTQPEALKRIQQFSNIELRIATEGSFHSKGYLFKKAGVYDLIIGSSNLTQTALCSNKEWNLKISAADQSELIQQAVEEFQKEFDEAQEVTDRYLLEYSMLWKAKTQFEREIKERREEVDKVEVKPNLMQREALDNIKQLRTDGKDKALLISATGTGKTYLSAFDVQQLQPKKFLFIVHRRTIAEEAMKTFKTLLGSDIKMGMYSGSDREMDADYLFSTVQTISKQDHLNKFDPAHFDYIVIDETHRAGADSYKRIMEHFTPKFMLGMTATPERTDGADVFQMFDYNIAYEIRLHRALEEEMLAPFHYYGVTDLTIDGEEIDDQTEFNKLYANERVDRIIENAQRYGCDDGEVRGLIFCSRNDIAHELSQQFNAKGYHTLALTGENSEAQRQDAIRRLETDELSDKLDYIFTVDIFNEGIDIPRVNQIIMLRPTQSAIVFVQQLGRGLRKNKNKDYLTVIDFIGNYNNNYLVPIALYGDNSYNKDTLRKLIASGSSLIPGASTINFDRISKEKIYASIDAANMQLKRELVKDFTLLKFKLGRPPMMMDFIEHGSRDPFLYIKKFKSYYNFYKDQEKESIPELPFIQSKLLELFANEINNAKRIIETVILYELIQNSSYPLNQLRDDIYENYSFRVSDEDIESSVNNLNFEFVTENEDKKLKPIGEIYSLKICSIQNNKIHIADEFYNILDTITFKDFLIDNIKYALYTFRTSYKPERFIEGFELYKKYTRKDVFRILNWNQNPVAQNVGGYLISPDKSNCPIFVNYEKEDHISDTTKYEDKFIDQNTFQWMSKNKRRLTSPDVTAIRNSIQSGMRLPLFIKKNNDEGKDMYYMGDVAPIEDSFEQKLMSIDGKDIPVVQVWFSMKSPVEDSIYEYLTSNQ